MTRATSGRREEGPPSPLQGRPPSREASYVRLDGEELHRRVTEARRLLDGCRVCPRACGARRLDGEPGACRADGRLRVSSVNLHHGEEPVISGTRGSGTVFLTHCNLACRFCQNFPISQGGVGRPMEPETLARRMVGLQEKGAHNINFVSPTHYAPQVLEAIALARDLGLRIPIVWNSNGYESPEMLALLDGVVDIYLPDFKYWDEPTARRLSGAPGYPEVARRALRVMWQQVGKLVVDGEGIAVRGLLVRHLVLPGGLDGAPEVLAFLATELGRDVAVSLMSQYFPAHRAHDHPLLRRRITPAEFDRAVAALEEAGIENGFVQERPYEESD